MDSIPQRVWPVYLHFFFHFISGNADGLARVCSNPQHLLHLVAMCSLVVEALQPRRDAQLGVVADDEHTVRRLGVLHPIGVPQRPEAHDESDTKYDDWKMETGYSNKICCYELSPKKWYMIGWEVIDENSSWFVLSGKLNSHSFPKITFLFSAEFKYRKNWDSAFSRNPEPPSRPINLMTSLVVLIPYGYHSDKNKKILESAWHWIICSIFKPVNSIYIVHYCLYNLLRVIQKEKTKCPIIKDI